MFLTLLALTFVLAVLTSFAAERVFKNPIRQSLEKVVGDALAGALQRYISFAIYVLGVSGGVPVYRLESYLDPSSTSAKLVMDAQHLALEAYRTILDTLWSITIVLLVFFVFTMIAYAIVRAAELRRQKPTG